MKNTILTILFLALNISAIVTSPTIILINGVPYLVELDDDTNITSVLLSVPYYFQSEMSHEEIVATLRQQLSTDPKKSMTQYEDIFVLDNVEFIEFIPKRALLDKIAVDRIRKIAVDYCNGNLSHIALNVQYADTQKSSILSENRINSVKDLLVAFGVDDTAISSVSSLNKEDDMNPYVRIEYNNFP